MGNGCHGFCGSGLHGRDHHGSEGSGPLCAASDVGIRDHSLPTVLCAGISGKGIGCMLANGVCLGKDQSLSLYNHSYNYHSIGGLLRILALPG